MGLPEKLDAGEQRKAGLRLLALVGRLPKMLKGGLDKSEREELALELLAIAAAIAVDAVD